MSETTKTAKKTVKIQENDLVNLIDSIVTEAVAVKKQEWINEQAAKTSESATMLENRIAKLEKLLAGKK